MRRQPVHAAPLPRRSFAPLRSMTTPATPQAADEQDAITNTTLDDAVAAKAKEAADSAQRKKGAALARAAEAEEEAASKERDAAAKRASDTLARAAWQRGCRRCRRAGIFWCGFWRCAPS